jgi:deoxyxylulose-5-phosphate synthase
LPDYSEVDQQDPSYTVFWICEQDVGWFDVAMQQFPLMGVVERAGRRVDDGCTHHAPAFPTGPRL